MNAIRSFINCQNNFWNNTSFGAKTVHATAIGVGAVALKALSALQESRSWKYQVFSDPLKDPRTIIGWILIAHLVFSTFMGYFSPKKPDAPDSS